MLQIYNPQDDEIRRRMAAAKAQGWDDATINKFALIDRAQNSMRQQQAAQQSAQQQAQKKQGNPFARMAAGFLPLALGAVGGVAGTLVAPGAGTAVGGGLGSAAGEALRRKLLGEKQDLGSTVIEGGLGALPGVGKAIMMARGARGASTAARTADGVIDASRAAKVAQRAGEGTQVGSDAMRTQRTARQSIAMRQLAKRAGQVAPQAEEGVATGGSYGMRHRPTMTGATADDITQVKSDMGLPKDFYDKPHYYANPREETYRESLAALQKARGNPDARIKIYRAAPKDEFNQGDWVTLSKKYAQQEAKAEGVPVHGTYVKAKDIHFAGDDINEFGYFPGGSAAANSATSPANTAIGALEKRAVANAAQPEQPGFFSGGINGMRQRLAERMAAESKPTRTAQAGDVLRETQRGTRVGSPIPGTSKVLNREGANSINDVIDTANQGLLKGGKSLRGQIDRVQQAQGGVYDELTRATKAANVKLTPADYTQIDSLVQKHLDDIGDVLDSPTRQKLMDKGLDRILYKSNDLVGLEKQRRVFDEGAKRLLQNPDTQGTVNAQIQRAYRSAIDEFITAKAPQLKEVKGSYAQLRQAEDLLANRLKQMDNAKNQGGLVQMLRGSGLKEGAQDVAGRALQKTGEKLGTLPARQLKQQFAARLLTGNLGRNMQPPPLDQDLLAQLNNPQTAAFTDTGGDPQMETINALVSSGITDPEEMSQYMDAINSGNPDVLAQLAGGGAGAAGGGTGLTASSTELFNQAIKVLQETGDTKAADQLIQMAGMAMDLEKAGGAGGKMSAAQQKTIMGTDTADQIISQIEKEVGNIPAGLLAGTATSLIGKLKPGGGAGAEAEAYNQSRGSKALMLIKAIQGSAGQISDVDRDMIMNAMPLVTDSPDIRRRKLNSLRQITNSYRTSAQGAPAAGGGTDYGDLLSQLNSGVY